MTLNIGDKAPDFAGKALDGSDISLGDFKGKQNLFLVFYAKAFSGVCATQLPRYNANLDGFKQRNTQVVAAVSGKRIRVVGVIVTNKGGSLATVKFQTATTDITAAHGLAASGGGYTRNKAWPEWVMQTAVGEALNINLAGNGAVGCDVEYWEVA